LTRKRLICDAEASASRADVLFVAGSVAAATDFRQTSFVDDKTTPLVELARVNGAQGLRRRAL